MNQELRTSSRPIHLLGHLARLGGFSSLRLRLGFVVEVHNTVFQVGFLEELPLVFSSSFPKVECDVKPRSAEQLRGAKLLSFK